MTRILKNLGKENFSEKLFFSIVFFICESCPIFFNFLKNVSYPMVEFSYKIKIDMEMSAQLNFE